MLIHDLASSLEITPREAGPPGTPSEGDLGLNVAATSPATLVGGPFAGRNDTVWIARDEWARFLEALRALERTRRGDAHLAAMSAAEFRLAIFATDAAGHVAAEGWVGREYAGRNGAWRDRVCFSLEIEPDRLPQLVLQFEALGAPG